MNIALQFLLPEPDSVAAFAEVARSIHERLPKHNFTFIVPKTEQNGLLKAVRGVGIASIEESRRHDWAFQYGRTLNCTGLLTGIDLSKRPEAALGTLLQLLEPEDRTAILKPAGELGSGGVTIEGPFIPCDGYGSAIEGMLLTLDRLGVAVSFVPTLTDVTHLASPRTRELALVRNFLHKDYVLFHTPTVTEAYLRMKTARKSIYTMWEATQPPSSWPPMINKHFGQLLVPSVFCQEVFRASGVKIPISVVPLGVSPERWPLLRRTRRRPFTFLLLANARWENPRKNYPMVLGAFKKAFGAKKDIRLILKISCGSEKGLPPLPENIEVIDARLTHEEVLRLMHRADCFLYPTTGEGYGLPPREAMCTGLPVIVTDWGALKEIGGEKTYYRVRTTLQQACFPDPNLVAANGGSTFFGEFAKVDEDHLIETMVYVYNHQEEALAAGLRASEWVRSNETYDISARSFLQALGIEGLVQ